MIKEIKRISSAKKVLFMSIILSINYVKASEDTMYKSIYNVSHGAVIYSHNNGPNQYLWADYAHNLSGSWKANANWGLLYNIDGTVSFTNQNSELCIQHYGTDYQIVEYKCTSRHEKQKFNFELTHSGAILIKFAHNGECLYMHSGTRYYSIYSGVCDRADSKFYWAIIPPLKL
ncbi:RICIN domain-containing protein [Yersinia mollaretii]|uniref:hypothetical protein n=1 Tax=Yersinia mollaretii TaxID=33060 RepID=UPI0011A8CB4F|nr:hypothetical protein [Yersinia mollaretii]